MAQRAGDAVQAIPSTQWMFPRPALPAALVAQGSGARSGASFLPGQLSARMRSLSGNFDAPTALVSVPSRSSRHRGAVAQLGERLNGIQEVDGSIPFGSTRSNHFRKNKLASALSAAISCRND